MGATLGPMHERPTRFPLNYDPAQSPRHRNFLEIEENSMIARDFAQEKKAHRPGHENTKDSLATANLHQMAKIHCCEKNE